MKRLIKLSMIFFIVALVSCNDNDNNHDIDNYQVDIATVQNPYGLSTFFFKLDNNKLMWVDESNFRNYAPVDGQRIVVNYSIISDKRATHLYDYDVRLNDAYNVLTKSIFNVTKATQDSIGNDSIAIEDMWIGSDYLNIQFVYPGYNKIHYINLVNDTSRVFTDGKTHLYFKHNSNNDSPVELKSGIVSFRLKSLQTGASTTNLNLVIHVYLPNRAAESTYDLKYDFSSSLLMLAPKHVIPKIMNDNFN